MTIRVLIADDDPVFRRGLRAGLADAPQVVVAGAAERSLAYLSAALAGGRAARPFPELTDREIEVLRLGGWSGRGG